MTTTPIRPLTSPLPDLDPYGDIGVVDLTASGWVLGLVLAAVSEGEGDEAIIAQVVIESRGNFRAVEGAYGRAVALLGEGPEDTNLLRTLGLLSRALRRIQADVGSFPPG